MFRCAQCGREDGGHNPGCSVGRSFEQMLRETEREIAADPEAHGTTAEEWERVRQWPGDQTHLHIAERCIHGETKRTCGHALPYARYRVRSVPCDASFCPSAPVSGEPESDGDGSDW